MLKGVGIVIIIAVSTGFGFYMSSRLRERHKRLFALCVFIDEIGDRIRTGEEFFKIIEASGAAVGIYVEGYGIRISREGLEPRDIALLEEFFAKLGMGDTDSQLRRCEVYGELLRRQEVAARTQVTAKSGLYGKIGFFSGLFISVLLI